MLNYSKTELGLQVLKDRSILLNAKQRQLLLLIGTDDFATLNETSKSHLAKPEFVQYLCEKGLIYNSNLSEIKTNITREKSDTHNQLDQIIVPRIDSSVHNESKFSPIKQSDADDSDDFAILDFDKIKELMQETLKQYCGLMAKPLIEKIAHATDLNTLQPCRMQWITHLQESKIPPTTLNFHLKQMNNSLLKITNQ